MLFVKYADDLNLMISFNSNEGHVEMELAVHKELQNLNLSSNTNDLSLNLLKSKSLLCSRKQI